MHLFFYLFAIFVFWNVGVPSWAWCVVAIYTLILALVAGALIQENITRQAR
jgi:hypothetical protein